MQIETIPVGLYEANCIIAWEDPRAAWIIDPGGEERAILAALAAHGLSPSLVALTHAHFDHIGAIPGILRAFPSLPVHIAPGETAVISDPRNCREPDYPRIAPVETLAPDLADGSTLSSGGLAAEILHTPGHTPGSTCFLFHAAGTIATGDTLFAGSCGRTDFPGGSAQDMRTSLARLATLPPELRVIPGHGPDTTIAREIATNPYMSGL